MPGDSYDENYPIAVLIEELRNEDVQFRLNSIKKLSTIAIALGPEKTRSQLIPFLTESVYDEDDVLVALTEQLIKLIPHIGGPTQVKVLLPLLETLGTVEETVVREKAVQVLSQIAPYFSPEDMRDSYFPLVGRFATAQWFATKISAASLFSVVYPRVEDEQRCRILEMIVDLAHDELNTVRNAVATKLGELALIMLGQMKMSDPQKFEDDDFYYDEGSENIDPNNGSGNGSWHFPTSDSYPPLNLKIEREHVIDKLIPIVTKLSLDETDTVRVLNFESSVLIAKGLAATGDDEPDRNLIKLVHSAATDKSWRVRCMLAYKFPVVFEAFGGKIVRDDLYDVFINLLKDAEPEVKVLSVNSTKAFAYLLAGKPVPPEIWEEILNSHEATTTNPWNATDNVISQTTGTYSSPGLSSANNPITTASTLLSSSGETTIGVQLKPIAYDTTNKPITASADTDNFIFKFNSLSESLHEYRKSSLINSKKMDMELKQPNTTGDSKNKSFVSNRMDLEDSDSIDCGDGIDICSIMTQQLIPALKELLLDGSAHVRVTLAKTIMHLVPIVGRAITINELMPIILALLKDECQEVRLNLIVRFDNLTELIGMETFTNTMMPLITQLASDRKWRVRLGIMDYLLLLAEKFGDQFFTEDMILLCLGWLIDHAYAIRLAAVINISKLAVIFGEEWTRDKLIPNVLELAVDENYHHRLICLQTLMSLSEVITPKLTHDRLIPSVLKMVTDKVPNIRFKVAQALCNLCKGLDKESLENSIQPILQDFLKDEDADVRHYASETAEKLGLCLK